MPFQMPGHNRGNVQITISQYDPKGDDTQDGMSEESAKGFARIGKKIKGMVIKKKPGMRYGKQIMGKYKNTGKYGA